jgi:SAM-dependent methyltransferase
MRIGAVAENPVEWVIARLNVAPRPLLETQMAYTLARLVMVGVKLGVFDVLAPGRATAAEVAERCQTSAVGTEKLLFALAGAGYLRAEDGGYALTPVARKWLVRESPHSITDKLLMQFLEWEWMERAEDYVRTGEPLELHATMTDEELWDLYQRGMRAMANALAGEAVRRMPVPKGASEMLDIGGSHGYYSVALCRRHEGLRSIILDLPQAIEHAAPLLAAERMGDRVVHRAGDALTEELGADAYDLVLIAQLVHHFSEAENRELAVRVARALRPGGVYAVLDGFRPPDGERRGPDGRLARVLLCPHKPVRHLGAGRDLGLAAPGGSQPAPADPLPDGAGRRDPSGRQARLTLPPSSRTAPLARSPGRSERAACPEGSLRARSDNCPPERERTTSPASRPRGAYSSTFAASRASCSEWNIRQRAIAPSQIVKTDVTSPSIGTPLPFPRPL